MNKDRFVGVWGLVSWETRRVRSVTGANETVHYPFGQHPLGTLFYDTNGSMAAQMMRVDRPLFSLPHPTDTERKRGTPEEIKGAFNGYVGYGGFYEIDEAKQLVIHHVSYSLYPNWVGTDLLRTFTFSNNMLTLTTLPVTIRDMLHTHVLHWQRIQEGKHL